MIVLHFQKHTFKAIEVITYFAKMKYYDVANINNLKEEQILFYEK
jgi:hypothetical protein